MAASCEIEDESFCDDSTFMTELGVLREICEEEITVDNEDDTSQLSITLHPATAGNKDAQFVCLTLLIQVPPDYPDIPPTFQFRNPRGMSEDELERIAQDLDQIAADRTGCEMIYDLIQAAKDSLTENNTPSLPCAICQYPFEAEDVFTKTECYHYFHSHCLARYIEHSLENSEEEDEQLTCPVCRELLEGDNLTQLNNAPAPQSEGAPQIEIMTETRQWQWEMSVIFERQKAAGGHIDKEAESKKHLISIRHTPTMSMEEMLSQQLKNAKLKDENDKLPQEQNKRDTVDARASSHTNRDRGNLKEVRAHQDRPRGYADRRDRHRGHGRNRGERGPQQRNTYRRDEMRGSSPGRDVPRNKTSDKDERINMRNQSKRVEYTDGRSSRESNDTPKRSQTSGDLPEGNDGCSRDQQNRHRQRSDGGIRNKTEETEKDPKLNGNSGDKTNVDEESPLVGDKKGEKIRNEDSAGEREKVSRKQEHAENGSGNRDGHSVEGDRRDSQRNRDIAGDRSGSRHEGRPQSGRGRGRGGRSQRDERRRDEGHYYDKEERGTRKEGRESRNDRQTERIDRRDYKDDEDDRDSVRSSKPHRSAHRDYDDRFSNRHDQNSRNGNWRNNSDSRPRDGERDQRGRRGRGRGGRGGGNTPIDESKSVKNDRRESERPDRKGTKAEVDRDTVDQERGTYQRGQSNTKMESKSTKNDRWESERLDRKGTKAEVDRDTIAKERETYRRGQGSRTQGKESDSAHTRERRPYQSRGQAQGNQSKNNSETGNRRHGNNDRPNKSQNHKSKGESGQETKAKIIPDRSEGHPKKDTVRPPPGFSQKPERAAESQSVTTKPPPGFEDFR